MKSHCGLLVMALVSVSAACSLRQSPATPEGVTVGVMQDGVTMRRLTFEGSDEFNRSQIAEALDAAGIEFVPTTVHNRFYDWHSHIDKLRLQDKVSLRSRHSKPSLWLR